MRTLPFLLLLLLLAPPGVAAPDPEGVVKSEQFNFEIRMPDSIDWEALKPPKDHEVVKAIFRTEYTGTEPLSYAEVKLQVIPMSKSFAKKKLDQLVMAWKSSMEGHLTNPRDRTETESTIGGQQCLVVDVKGDWGAGNHHVTWIVTRMGSYAYILWTQRAFKAIGDEDLEKEIAEIRNSMKFLKEMKVSAHKDYKKGGAGPVDAGGGVTGGEAVDPESIKKEKIRMDFWRFEVTKPEGLVNIPNKEFSESEKSNNVIAKFRRKAEQSFIEVRIYCQSKVSQRYTIQQLSDSRIKYFEKTYKENARLKPEIEQNKWKPKYAKETIHTKLTGRRATTETTHWYFAQCKNDRQYQIQIYVTGSQGEKDWAKAIKDLLKSFKPFKK